MDFVCFTTYKGICSYATIYFVSVSATTTAAGGISKFSGNGVLFKAKLFGTADVNEPRGMYPANHVYVLVIGPFGSL